MLATAAPCSGRDLDRHHGHPPGRRPPGRGADREQEAAYQLAAALERERAAAEHLRAVDEMKTTFLQAVSHDLRTPLTTILGIALTLEQRAADLPAPTSLTCCIGCRATPASLIGPRRPARSGPAGPRHAHPSSPVDRPRRPGPAGGGGRRRQGRASRWWSKPHRCAWPWTPPSWSGSSRTCSSMRPSTLQRGPPSGSGCMPRTTASCWSKTRDPACRPSFASGSFSPSTRAATPPTTPRLRHRPGLVTRRQPPQRPRLGPGPPWWRGLLPRCLPDTHHPDMLSR